MAIWTTQYEASAIPTSATPAWTRNGGTPDTESVSSGIFTLGDGPAVVIQTYYSLEDTDISNSGGFTIEARIRVVTSGGPSDCIMGVELASGAPWIYIYIDDTSIEINDGTQLATYTMDTTDNFHIYRMTVRDSVATVWVDGVQRMQATSLDTSGTGQLVEFGCFGEGGSYESQWDYVYFTSANAYEIPENHPRPLRTGEIITNLKTATTTASNYLSDQNVAQYGSSRREEVLAQIGEGNREFKKFYFN